MTQNFARYHARSPRYILNTEDDSLVRVAGPRQVPWEEGTEIKNVSLTGLAFIAPEDLCPILGEIVKIQFIAPGGKQLASHAIVIRLDPLADNEILVGLHFYKMEMGHRVMLAQGLAKKIKATSDHQQLESKREASAAQAAWVEQFPNRVLLVNYFLLWAMIMQLLTQENWLSLFSSWMPF